jgi:uncharacterized membrane protein
VIRAAEQAHIRTVIATFCGSELLPFSFRGGVEMESEIRGDYLPEPRGDFLPLVGAAGVGAALAYFLDPAQGSRRRHLVGDKLIHATDAAADALGSTRRDFANRTRGITAAARRPFADDTADDVVIANRIRAELGRLVSHPGAIEVGVENTRATLEGAVLATEVDTLVAGVRKVRGVTDVQNFLKVYASGEGIPGLQGTPRGPARTFELMQENWAPATRLAAAVAGGTLLYAAGRSGRETLIGRFAGLAGVALLARSVTNKPFDQLLGIGAGRRAVDVQKSINIAAPLPEVFAWLIAWERWPEWMSHVREVKGIDGAGAEGERTHWVVDGPAGAAISWDAVTTRFIPDELVAWKTVDGSPIAHSGVMRFLANDDGTTRVDIQMTYNPIIGAAGHAVATIFRRDPKQQLDDDLARLKTVIEQGRPPHDAAAAGS